VLASTVKYGVKFKVTYDKDKKSWVVPVNGCVRHFHTARAALYCLMWGYVERSGQDPFVFFSSEIISADSIEYTNATEGDRSQ
jgi:hypothetical protein